MNSKSSELVLIYYRLRHRFFRSTISEIASLLLLVVALLFVGYVTQTAGENQVYGDPAKLATLISIFFIFWGFFSFIFTRYIHANHDLEPLRRLQKNDSLTLPMLPAVVIGAFFLAPYYWGNGVSVLGVISLAALLVSYSAVGVAFAAASFAVTKSKLQRIIFVIAFVIIALRPEIYALVSNLFVHSGRTEQILLITFSLGQLGAALGAYLFFADITPAAPTTKARYYQLFTSKIAISQNEGPGWITFQLTIWRLLRDPAVHVWMALICAGYFLYIYSNQATVLGSLIALGTCIALLAQLICYDGGSKSLSFALSHRYLPQSLSSTLRSAFAGSAVTFLLLTELVVFLTAKYAGFNLGASLLIGLIIGLVAQYISWQLATNSPYLQRRAIALVTNTSLAVVLLLFSVRYL